MTERETGRVVNLNGERGFFWIRTEQPGQGRILDYFAHRSALRGGLLMADIVEGRELSFDPTDSPKGPRAENILPA